MPRLSEKKKEMIEEMMKEALYRASASVISDNGWPGLTMEKVAESAGVSKGTVYNYFRDKKDLVWFVMTSMAQEIEDRINEIIEGNETSLEALKEIISHELRGRRQNAHMATAFIHAFHDEPELRERMFSSNHPFSRVERMTRDLVTRGIERGEFRAVDPTAMVAVLNSILMGISRQWATGQLSLSTDVMTDFVISLLTEGLIRKDNQ